MPHIIFRAILGKTVGKTLLDNTTDDISTGQPFYSGGWDAALSNSALHPSSTLSDLDLDPDLIPRVQTSRTTPETVQYGDISKDINKDDDTSLTTTTSQDDDFEGFLPIRSSSALWAPSRPFDDGKSAVDINKSNLIFPFIPWTAYVHAMMMWSLILLSYACTKRKTSRSLDTADGKGTALALPEPSVPSSGDATASVHYDPSVSVLLSGSTVRPLGTNALPPIAAEPSTLVGSDVPSELADSDKAMAVEGPAAACPEDTTVDQVQLPPELERDSGTAWGDDDDGGGLMTVMGDHHGGVSAEEEVGVNPFTPFRVYSLDDGFKTSEYHDERILKADRGKEEVCAAEGIQIAS